MIIFMGPSGAGKSVQGNLLADYLGYTWMSTGEYLRANITPERKAQMLAGKLLGDDEIIGILEDFFRNIPDTKKCILDGFPRTLRQAEWLYAKQVSEELRIDTVIYLDASKEVVRERLLGRGRQDDTPEVLDRRFVEYEQLTLPIISWFGSKGIRVEQIDAEQTVDQIQAEIRRRIKE